MSSITISSDSMHELDKSAGRTKTLFLSVFRLSIRRREKNEIRRCSGWPGERLRESPHTKAAGVAAIAQGLAGDYFRLDPNRAQSLSRESPRVDTSE